MGVVVHNRPKVGVVALKWAWSVKISHVLCVHYTYFLLCPGLSSYKPGNCALPFSLVPPPTQFFCTMLTPHPMPGSLPTVAVLVESHPCNVKELTRDTSANACMSFLIQFMNLTNTCKV